MRAGLTGKDTNCPLLIRGVHNSLSKQWREAEDLCSLPVPLLPWAHCPMGVWVCGQQLGLRCPVIDHRVDSLPSLQMPALSTGCMDSGLPETFYSSFYSGPIKAIIAAARLFTFFFFSSLRASPSNVRILDWQTKSVRFPPCSVPGVFWPVELGLWDPSALFQLSRSDECGIWILMNIIMPQNFPKFYMLGPFQILCKATHLEK